MTGLFVAFACSSASADDYYMRLRPRPRIAFQIARRMTAPRRVTSIVGKVMASLIVPTWKIGLRM
jgi:hypothetical protein